MGGEVGLGLGRVGLGWGGVGLGGEEGVGFSRQVGKFEWFGPSQKSRRKTVQQLSLVCISVRFLKLEATWANLYGVDLLNSQEGNSSLQKKGVQRYLSGKRMQMQTNTFNKYVLFFLCGFPLFP